MTSALRCRPDEQGASCVCLSFPFSSLVFDRQLGNGVLSRPSCASFLGLSDLRGGLQHAGSVSFIHTGIEPVSSAKRCSTKLTRHTRLLTRSHADVTNENFVGADPFLVNCDLGLLLGLWGFGCGHHSVREVLSLDYIRTSF